MINDQKASLRAKNTSAKPIRNKISMMNENDSKHAVVKCSSTIPNIYNQMRSSVSSEAAMVDGLMDGSRTDKRGLMRTGLAWAGSVRNNN